MENKTDEELALLSKQGDEQAAEVLFKRYKPLMNKICHNYFLYGADSDDVLQEAMMGLYKACLSYNKQVASFYTFANICIKRKVLDAVKSANTLKSKILSDCISLGDDEDNSNIVVEDGNPGTKMIEMENFNELKNNIFCKLSDFELLVLKYYLQGESYQQIAKRLDKKEKSIDNALLRIKQKLKYLDK